MSSDIPKETNVWREEKFQVANQGANFQSRNIKYKGVPGGKKKHEANL